MCCRPTDDDNLSMPPHFSERLASTVISYYYASDIEEVEAIHGLHALTIIMLSGMD